MTARDRGRLDEAEDWYRQALAIFEEIGDRPGAAISYTQLGLPAEDRAQALLALEWNTRCVTLFAEFSSPLTRTAPAALAGLTRSPACQPWNKPGSNHRPARAAGGTRLHHPPSRAVEHHHRGGQQKPAAYVVSGVGFPAAG